MEIEKIIEACGKNGVSSFKMGDLEIRFNGFVFQTEKDYPNTVEPITENVKVDPKFQDQHDYEVGSDEFENLMVTDPAAYEEALLKNELEDYKTHTDEK